MKDSITINDLSLLREKLRGELETLEKEQARLKSEAWNLKDHGQLEKSMNTYKEVHRLEAEKVKLWKLHDGIRSVLRTIRRGEYPSKFVSA